MQSLGRRLGLSSSLSEEAMGTGKRGIVSILRSDCEATKSASLRRTLSADMSSKKWLIQPGFSPIKKIASSEEFPALSIHDTEVEECKETEAPGQFEVWTSIQHENKNNKKEEMEKRDQLDIWSSIVSQKAQEDPKSLPPVYVHPLEKRSSTSLSERSLEICTESLGSETGSEGFSSYPPSEAGDPEDEEQEVLAQPTERQETVFVKERKSPSRSFPPPIPSLSNHDGGASVHVRSRRDNGRLVLEAVSVPSQNNFHAQRRDGRLLLTFVSHDEPNYEEEKENDMEDLAEKFEGIEEEEDIELEEEAEEDAEGTEEDVMDQAPVLSSRVINLKKLIMMSKPMDIVTKNPTWPKRFNEMVEFEQEVEVEESTPPLAVSLPPLPSASAARMIPQPPAAFKTPTTAVASLNVYEYYWRPEPMSSSTADKINSDHKLILSKSPTENAKQKLLVLIGKKGDQYLFPLLKGCKESRRTFWFWEPHCIATS